MSRLIESPAFADGYCERLDEVARQSAGLSDQISGAAGLIRYWRDRAIQAEQLRANLLGDEAVERAARAAYQHKYPGRGPGEIPDHWYQGYTYRNFAKVCIEAAIKAALGNGEQQQEARP